MNPSLVSGLSNPWGLVLSGSDLFVTNENVGGVAGSGTIGEYTTSGTTVNPSLVSGLTGPIGVAVSGSDLFVANSDSNTTGEYTTSGATVNPSLISGLNLPGGIAVTNAVPEPSTRTLLGSALLGLGVVYLRRRKAKRLDPQHTGVNGPCREGLG